MRQIALIAGIFALIAYSWWLLLRVFDLQATLANQQNQIEGLHRLEDYGGETWLKPYPGREKHL